MYSRTISKRLAAAVALAVPATMWLGAGTASASRGGDADLRMQVTSAALTRLVGNDHSVTVTLTEDTGTGEVPVVNAHPVATLVGDGTITSNSCASAGTDVSGRCTVNLRSAVPGSATVAFAFAGIPNAASPQMQWVDYRVQVSPTGLTKFFGEQHDQTVTLESDNGDGSGFQPVPNAPLTLSLTDGRLLEVLGGTIARSLQDGTCTTDAAGRCSVRSTSLMLARAVLEAEYDVEVDGASLNYKDSATTRWVPGSNEPAPQLEPETDAEEDELVSSAGDSLVAGQILEAGDAPIAAPAVAVAVAPAADLAPVVLSELPRTGAAPQALATLGLGLSLAGLTAVVIGRRRPQVG